jgi:hypothetical protein
MPFSWNEHTVCPGMLASVLLTGLQGVEEDIPGPHGIPPDLMEGGVTTKPTTTEHRCSVASKEGNARRGAEGKRALSVPAVGRAGCAPRHVLPDNLSALHMQIPPMQATGARWGYTRLHSSCWWKW